jgi:hypothetical protein
MSYGNLIVEFKVELPQNIEIVLMLGFIPVEL